MSAATVGATARRLLIITSILIPVMSCGEAGIGSTNGRPGVVRLSSRSGRTGVGVILRDRRTIVTCDHVISHESACEVEFPDGSRGGAAVVERGCTDDIALLRLDAPTEFAPLTLRTVPASEGGIVRLLGWNAEMSSARICSPAYRCEELPGVAELARFVVLSLGAESGSSGSPWIDESGAVVGLQSVVISSNDGSSISLAIPAASIIARLGGAGASVAGMHASFERPSGSISEYLSARYPIGVMVTSMSLDSCLAGGGIGVGDRVCKIDDIRIDCVDAVHRALALHVAGDRVRVEFGRGARVMTTTVVLQDAASNSSER